MGKKLTKEQKETKKLAKIAKKLEQDKKIDAVKNQIKDLDDKYEVISKLVYGWKEISEKVLKDINNHLLHYKIVHTLGGFYNIDDNSDLNEIYISKKPISDNIIQKYADLKLELLDIEEPGY